MLPNQSNDVIHIETDGIYMHNENNQKQKLLENIKNYENEDSYPINEGEELGNIKIEHESNNISYFMAKKLYYLPYYDKKKGNVDKCIIKGMPQSTKTEDGRKVDLVDRSVYEDLYAGNKVQRSFYTLKKSLFGNEQDRSFSIQEAMMTRELSPELHKYNEYPLEH
jgi:hypothetical protein